MGSTGGQAELGWTAAENRRKLKFVKLFSEISDSILMWIN